MCLGIVILASGAGAALGQELGSSEPLTSAAKYVLHKIDPAMQDITQDLAVDSRALRNEEVLFPKVGERSERIAAVAAAMGARQAVMPATGDCKFECLLGEAEVLLRFGDPIADGDAREVVVLVQAVYRNEPSAFDPRALSFLTMRLRLGRSADGTWTVMREEFVAAS
jgi:hypothetical protein